MIEQAHANIADAHTEQPSLRGRRAVITGGTTGIGRAIAVLLASQGVRVFVCGRTPEHLDDALARIREVGTGGGIALDLAEDGAAEEFVSKALEALGGIDIVVLNAGLPIGGLADANAAEIRYLVDTNLTAIMTTARAALDHLNETGDLLVIGSMASISRTGSSTVYTATKTGVQAFADALRKELAPRGNRVGLIEPGLTGSDMQTPEIPLEKQRAMIAGAKMLRAEDIAVAAHFFLTQPRRAVISTIRVEPRLED